MEIRCSVDNETSTGALVLLNYTKSAKNIERDGVWTTMCDARPFMESADEIFFSE